MTFVPTSEQHSIITYDPTNLRVAAGAGTGKTTTIVERLAHFVALGTPPTRALGITFTVKASDELRTKLRERLTSHEHANEVEVATYHGFASAILDEFGTFVGHDTDAMLLDEGHRYELGQLVLKATPTDLDLTSMQQRIENLMELNDGLDRHLRTPADLIAAAPAPSDDEPWATRVDLARVAQVYRGEKERLNLVEFSDLISRAVRLVQEFPEIAAQLAERYDIVLLDEYQDTDPAQRLLLTSIFGDTAAVTAVGDTDQTIYEWRGASLDNFQAFPQHFPRADGIGTQTLPLSVNRRSDRLILDLANRIREELPTIDGAEPLTPAPDADPGAVVAAWFASERAEAEWITRDIIAQHEAGVAWSEIAILVRKRAWIPILIAALQRADIPTSVSDPGTLLRVPEVADVLAWLRIVADPTAELSLIRILLGGQYRLGIADLNHLRLHAKSVGAPTLFGAVTQAKDVTGLAPDTVHRLERFVQLHDTLMRYAQTNTVTNSINRIVEVIGFWDEAAALRPGESTTARLNIARFMNIAHGWKPIEGRPTVQRFLRYIAALDLTGREDALTPPVRSVEDAIELTTIHGSKGLEWDVVYIPGVQKRDFPGGVRKFDDPESQATAIPYAMRLDADSLSDVALADGKARKEILRQRNRHSELRLAYVAVTRARHRLVMSGHAWQDSVKNPKEPSELLGWARDLQGSTDGPWCEDPGEKPPYLSLRDDVVIDDPVFADGIDAALRSAIDDAGWMRENYPDMASEADERAGQMILEIGDLAEPEGTPDEPRFATSVTNLVALAQCPLRFKWIHYDKLPRRPSTAARRGTEFHRRIEMHNLGRIALDEATVETYDGITGDVDGDVTGAPGGTPKSDPWETFESSRYADMMARFAEVPFEVAVDEGSVRGKIDAVYETAPDTWEIVDYKSGRSKDDAALRVQLQAYAVAATDGAFSVDRPDHLRVTFAYFGGGELVEVSEDIDETWIDDARNDLSRLVRLGAEGPWDPTPSPTCRSCDFLLHCPAGKESVDS